MARIIMAILKSRMCLSRDIRLVGDKVDVQSREKWWNELRDEVRGHCEMSDACLHLLLSTAFPNISRAFGEFYLEQVQLRLRSGLQRDGVVLIWRLHHVSAFPLLPLPQLHQALLLQPILFSLSFFVRLVAGQRLALLCA